MPYEKYHKELKRIFTEETNGLIGDDDLEQFTHFIHNNWATENIKLYRYSPANFYNIRNFETGKLRLTENGNLNDIYEGLPVDLYEQLDARTVKMLGDLAYIKCFSETNDNTLMWSHYADQHKGFCVEYDLSELEADADVINHIFPIFYSTTRYLDTDIAEMVRELKELNYDIENNNFPSYSPYLEDMTALFLHKSKAWEYEKEWRIVYTNLQIQEIDDPLLSKYIVPFECATGVYLGYRIDAEIKDNILEIVDRINDRNKHTHRTKIKVFQTQLDARTYDLRFKEINTKGRR